MIKTEREPTDVLIEIRDDGAGIPEDVQPRIFEPFFTTKQVGEGTGLGLDTVARLIRNHYGDIRVTSKPGDTCFQISLTRTISRRYDNNMNKTITIFLLLINLFAADSIAGQTRRGTTNRRAPRRTTRSRPSARPPVAAPPSSAAVTTVSGLTYIVTWHGAGRPLKTGDRVTVNYTGLLTNGAKFDSSLDRGTPFTFQIGEGRVIKGWDEGVARLRVGDHATFILPPQLAYGARGAGSDIPPDSTLVFIIEVLSVEDAPMPSAPLND